MSEQTVNDLTRGLLQTLAEAMRAAPPAACWIIGFSGGTDSLALLELCRMLPGHPPLLAAHLHHGIRGAEADADEAFCRAHCLTHNIAYVAGHADVPQLARDTGENLEQAARRARQRFFCGHANQALPPQAQSQPRAGAPTVTASGALLLLAHHRDDQIETLLMRLLRGCGWRGLRGIPATGTIAQEGVRLPLIRPLLHVARTELWEFVRRCGLHPREDNSNADLRFTRNRLRLRVLPALRENDPHLDRRLLAAAERAAEVEAYIQQQAARLSLQRTDHTVRITPRNLSSSTLSAHTGDSAKPQGIAGTNGTATEQADKAGWRRAVEDAAAMLAGAELGRLRKRQMQALDGLIQETMQGKSDTGGSVMLCGGLVLRRQGAGLLLHRTGNGEVVRPHTVVLADGLAALRCGITHADEWGSLSARLVRLPGLVPETDHPWVAYLRPEALRFPLSLRMPHIGERLRGPGRSPDKRVSEILKDRKIPREQRQSLRILADAEGIVWLPGVFPAGRSACIDLAGEAVRVEISPK